MPAEAEGARVVQLRDDQYVLPGIFDVHAHYNMTLGKSVDSRLVQSRASAMSLFLFDDNGYLNTTPPRMTNTTSFSAWMSDAGLPRTAMMSAS